MCTNGDPLQQVVSALDALVEADAALCADREAIVALHRQLDRLEAVVTRATGAFERERAWEADGARTASAWLAVECSLPVRVARRRVAVGRALRDLPVAEAAWLAGKVSGPAVALLADARGWSPDVSVPLAVGFLGAFTTFSTFTGETHLLLRTDRTGTAVAYVLVSVGLGIVAAAGGYRLGAALR